jgi:hypothetical protein
MCRALCCSFKAAEISARAYIARFDARDIDFSLLLCMAFAQPFALNARAA